MNELSMGDTARAIRPFLAELAGPAATDLDLRLDTLLAAEAAGRDVDDELADVLSVGLLADWTTYFFENGTAPPVRERRIAEPGRIISSFDPDGASAHDPGAPATVHVAPAYTFDAVHLDPFDTVQLDPAYTFDLEVEQPAAEEPPAAEPAYPRLDAPGEVAPGKIFTITVGLRPDADGAVTSTGPMDLPADIELQVAVVFDPMAFTLAALSSTEPATSTKTLQRTSEDPWPSTEFRFVALAGEKLLAARSIAVKFLRGSQMVGFASRALIVRSPGDAASGPTPSGRSVETPAITPDPAAGQLDLRQFAGDEIDLLLLIQRSADVDGTRLVFTAHSRHPEIEDQAKPLTSELKAESKGGTTPQQIGQEMRFKVASTNDEEDLFAWLTGMGTSIFGSLPPEIGAVVRKATQQGTDARPARILLFSEEPYIPWELAVDPEVWPSAMATTAPFLGAHAAISRWFLDTVPPPKSRPVPCIDVREKVLVSAHYDGVGKWAALPEAEAEVTKLVAVLAPGVAMVQPGLHDVLELLDGTPPADLMHFALHGNFDPAGYQGGLVLLRTDGGTTTAQFLQENHVKGKRLRKEPFVYLNACQVATGNSATFGSYGGLAAAFLTAGARGVLAPLWNIQDGTASALAGEFYQLSAGAERLPAAEILRRWRARYTLKAVRDREPNVNATLIAFQLFGHPGLRLFPEADPVLEMSHA